MFKQLEIAIHQFAKRQMTWFKKDQDVNWFSPLEKDQIINFINSKITCDE